MQQRRDARQQGIPAFGDGGVVFRPTVALVGEKGPEAIVPLGKGSSGIGGVTIGAIHVHNEADEDRLIAKLTRLVQLQGLDASALAADALGTRLRTVPLPAQRGDITDAGGVVQYRLAPERWPFRLTTP